MGRTLSLAIVLGYLHIVAKISKIRWTMYGTEDVTGRMFISLTGYFQVLKGCSESQGG